ncbi:MAG: hypothetical protein D6737_06810 [Chloroflexi bacterium]|nr:MAG: hypothetical protein D6737_06810 [Chloroflexota bacterium]
MTVDNVEQSKREDNQPKRLNSPDPVIRSMYLEITNISQGLNIALLVENVTDERFRSSIVEHLYSPILFALASLLITIIFWTRYYFDTRIINRSYRTFAALWFFIHAVTVGINVNLVQEPSAWMLSAGVLLFFGAGFYYYNLAEIRRKQRMNVISVPEEFIEWQTRRMFELVALSILSFIGALLIFANSQTSFSVSVVALIAAVWQLLINRDYLRFDFIHVGE